MEEKLQKKYCPMTETIFYTLLALLTPNHGYGIMKFVRELTRDRVKMGTGTLYTMLGRLVEDKMIVVINEEDGKKTYQITEDGKILLFREVDRLRQQYENGIKILGEYGGKN
ncbi:MAG: PadR family transcriptional regulator [Lachnospiraceae bacterium]|nr:PadR family transcriptional regulator [Lachnospiraceae bacterium]